jgi:hypothetical protein
MSDFISGLRDDLVDAADRHRASVRPRRAWTRLPRVWRPALAAATVAAAVVAIALAASKLSPPPSPAVRPAVAARVHIGGQPQDAVLADGAIWVSDFTGHVIRVDPASGRVTARIDVVGHPQAIAAGLGAVWVVSPSLSGNAERSVLSRIDPARGQVVDRIPVRGYVESVAVGDGAVWLIDSDRGALVRIDPASHAHSVIAPFAKAGTLAVGGNSRLWAVGDDGTVVTVDGRSPVDRLAGIAVGHGAPENTLAADREGAWLVGGGDSSSLLQIEAGQVARRIAVEQALGPIALGEGVVWVVSGNPDGPHPVYRLAVVDPSAEKVTAWLDIGHQQPTALLTNGRDAWVISADGTALLVKARTG